MIRIAHFSSPEANDFMDKIDRRGQFENSQISKSTKLSQNFKNYPCCIAFSLMLMMANGVNSGHVPVANHILP